MQYEQLHTNTEHQQLVKCTEFVQSVCRNCIILFVLVNVVMGFGLQQTEELFKK